MQSDQIKITYLDASTVDIYSNCQLVIIIIDPRQKSSIDYLKEVIPEVPKDIPIVVLLNFKDQHIAWDVDVEDIHKELDSIRDDISFIEISVGNCYGLNV